MKNLKIMQTFNEKNIPSLTTTVLGALELFINEGLPKTKFPKFKKPIIVGSGNAIATAKILFENQDVVFANEDNYKDVLKIKGIDGAIVFSASGEKHGAIISSFYKQKKIDTYLITCNKNSSASKIIGEKNTIVTSKNREPYTYNTSTYLGWVLAKTKEDPKEIFNFINKFVKRKIPKNIGKYNGYLLITPNEFEGANKLFNVKFMELFGRLVSRDVETYENMKHAVTVVSSKKELCIQFGEGDKVIFKNDILKIPLPKGAKIGTMMAIGYYVIGQIQDNKPQYFKKEISLFIAEMNKTKFGKNLKVIVE